MTNEPRPGKFSTLLESALEERGWTKAEFARRVPVSRGAVNNWRTGELPSADTCFHIARTLGLNPLRVLEACNYAPGVSGLLDLAEQLKADNDELLELLSPTPNDGSSGSGLGALVASLAQSGAYRYTVVPWLRGRQSQIHYADWIVLDSRDQRTGESISQGEVESQHRDALAIATAWWDGPENWEHVLKGAYRPTDESLVINCPRYVARRRGRGSFNVNAPNVMAVLGAHWCGQAEVARFIAGWLDYDYALPELSASIVHRTLAHRWHEPTWERDRLDLVRTFALSTPVSRKRVWAADFWDDADAVRMIASAPTTPYVVLLNPSDELLEYSATRRQDLGHCKDGRSRDEDLAVMRNVRNDVRSIVSALPRQQRMIVPIAPAPEAWSAQGEALASVDGWFDHFAEQARSIYQNIVGEAPPDGLS